MSRYRRSIDRLIVPSVLLGVVLLVAGPPASANDAEQPGPMEIIKSNTGKVLEILRAPQLEGEEHKQERRRRVHEAAGDAFDWPEVGRRVLARHWWDRTEEEREEFIDLFQQVLQRTYMRRIEENAEGEVHYRREEIEDRYASVHLLAAAPDGTEVPVVYRLHKLSEEEQREREVLYGWLIFDVRIEGVSLVSNYRSQFNDIIIGRGYDNLVQRLKQRVEQE